MNKTTNDTANASSMETLWKVLRFIGKYRFLLILSIILAAISVILQLYVPVLFGNAIDDRPCLIYQFAQDLPALLLLHRKKCLKCESSGWKS